MQLIRINVFFCSLVDIMTPPPSSDPNPHPKEKKMNVGSLRLNAAILSF